MMKEQVQREVRRELIEGLRAMRGSRTDWENVIVPQIKRGVTPGDVLQIIDEECDQIVKLIEQRDASPQTCRDVCADPHCTALKGAAL